MPGIQLSIVLAQFDRQKHPRALTALLATLDRLASADPFVAVVDNARPGDWVHNSGEGVVHLGGDGWAREFSAFDRGLAALEAMGRRTDVFALVTDSVVAYGENILDLVDDQALACSHRLQASVGWVDTWGEDCRIADLDFAAWLRTCFVLVPAAVLPLVRPLAADLEPLGLFGEDPTEPFSPRAEISDKVGQCLVEWLTTERVRSPYLRCHWHSQFDLTPNSRPLFRAKASAILREQLLSARLKRAKVPCYGLRGIRGLSDRGEMEAFLNRGGQADYQWLGERELAALAAKGRPTTTASPPRPAVSAGWPLGPRLVLQADPRAPRARQAAAYFEDRVLPLIRQRFSRASLEVAGDRPAGSLEVEDHRPRIVMRLGPAPRRRTSRRSQPFGTLALDDGAEDPTRRLLVHDRSASGIARICCRLLEESERRDRAG